eukprot:g32972.t1
MMRKPVMRGLATAAVCVMLCAAVGCSHDVGGKAAGTNDAATRLKVVSVITATQRELKRNTTQPATVHAFQQAEIHAKVSGYVDALKADIGQSVEPGAPLAVISVPEMLKSRDSLQAEVNRLKAIENRRAAEQKLAAANKRAAEALRDQALAQIEQVEAQLAADVLERDRVKNLVADMSVAARLLDEAEKKYQASKASKTAATAVFTSAKAQVDVATEKVNVAAQIAKAAAQETIVAQKKLDEMAEMLKYATLKAPFKGIVTRRNVDKGDLVRNLQTTASLPRVSLFTVADISKVRVHIRVPENDAPYIKPGAEVVLRLRSQPGREWKGEVTRFSNRLDDQTQTMLVEVVLDNRQEDGGWLLYPGMYGEATITLARKSKSLVLPAEAIRFDSDGKGSVYVVDVDDTIRIVAVKTGIDFGDEIEIVGGVSADDRIVGAVIGRLKAGQTIDRPMLLIRFALRNPFAVLAMSIGMCLLGFAVIPQMPLDILPDFRKPVVVSFFSYPGLPTMDMEKSVSSRVERALTLAGGIEHQESRTVPGAAVIKVHFQPGTNPNSAMNDIVNLEASDMFHLPPGIEWPFTLRSEPANLPVILAAISGEGLGETELYKIGYYAVRNKMGGLKGVQIPHPFGGKFRQMMIYVDPMKLRAQGLSTADVVKALRKSNLVLAAGSAKIGGTDYQVHPTNTLATPKDIEAVPIGMHDGKVVFIRDVGYVKDDAAIQYNIVRVNGKRSVYCPLLREPGENTIAVVDRIRKGIAEEIPRMKERGDIPEAAEITLVNDQSGYIRNAMRNLFYETAIGALLVVIVVAVFLRRLLPTIAIVGVMLMLILIGALGFYFTGNTINVMTLGGISLAIGTVVDVGIVVVENIVRHQQMGKSPIDAARDGAAEVSMPVLAGTVTTLAVFVPIIFLSGMIRYLFEPLSVAAVMTIGASYFIGLTVIPAFCARFVRTKVRDRQTAEGTASGSLSAGLDTERLSRSWFGRSLKTAMNVGWLVVLFVAIGVGGSLVLLPFVGSELFPDVDAGTFEIRLKTKPGTRLENTEALVAGIEETIKDVIPETEIDTIISNIGLPVGKGAGFSTVLSSNSGPDTAYLIVNLKQSGRSTSTRAYVKRLRNRLHNDYPEEQFLFVSGGIVNMALNEGVPVPISVQVSAGTIEKCREKAEVVVEKLRTIPGAADVQIAQSLDYPQFDIQVDRTRAKYLGVDQEEVAQTILAALGSSVGYAPTIWIDPKTGIDFFMGVQYCTNSLQSLEGIRNIPIALKTKEGTMTIPLSNIATIKRVTIPAEIAHYNIARVYDVFVNVSDRDVGSVAADVEEALGEIPEESGVSYTLRGPVTTMHSGAENLGYGMLVASVLVYLVLLAQFRSFVDPFIIILAVPLGISGVLVMLWATNTTINIQSMMGTLMMIGVAVNNSILIVEFANQLCAEGYAPKDAARIAAQVRLRPILMTSLTLLAAMLPLSVKLAPGGEAMIPLARAVIGGMLVSMVLTLVLVPCVYGLLKRPAAAKA